MKTLGLIVCCLVFAASVFALSGPPSAVKYVPGNALDQRWGPDTYGYRAIDSHETDGPTFAWRDISATGTQVNGLQDDNVVGPFPIGFSFHYYTDDYTQFWVGSNGYIQFIAGGLLAQTFPIFPTPAPPNAVLGGYVADWFFGGGEPSRCYYQSIGGDSLIVMWKNVRAWGQSGNLGDHNFEIILTRLDSGFTYQYGQSTTNDVSNNDIEIGNENASGNMGLSLFTMIYPPNNTAIKYFYPDTVSIVLHDMAAAGVQNPRSQAFFLLTGDTLRPVFTVRNAGNQTESSYHAVYSVRTISNTLLASRDTTMGTIAPSQAVTINYGPLWVAGAPAAYRVTGRVNLTNDVNHGNDSTRVQLHTITLPGELYYDDNSSEQGWSWAGGNGGMGNQFVPPVYPCRITQLRYYIATTGTGFTAQIWSDSSGMPGHVVWSTQVNNPAVGWATVPVPDLVRIDSGAFYVAWMQQTSDIAFGIDSVADEGISRRSWEYAGGWAENRLNETANVMIRATISIQGLAAEPGAAAPVPATYALHAAYPNPFNPSTSLTYDVAKEGEVTLKIFDLLGHEVATLVNGRHNAGSYTVSWNAATAPSGMYFAVLKAGEVHKMQKLLLVK